MNTKVYQRFPTQPSLSNPEWGSYTYLASLYVGNEDTPQPPHT